MQKPALPPSARDIRQGGFHPMFRRKNAILCAILAAWLMMMLNVACFANFKQGDTLPDLGSFKLEGKLPENLKGQVILLDFWASWCGPCKISFPAMQDLTKKYADQGLTIIAVSVDEKQENMQRFLKSAKVSFTVVRDAQHKLVAAADIRGMPTSFLIDRAGKIRFIHTGFDRDETPRQYAKEIEELLREPKP
jgi:thiol-disulfide isomerase/thioredoxin